MNKKIIFFLIAMIIIVSAAAAVKYFRAPQNPPQKYYTAQYNVNAINLENIAGVSQEQAIQYKNKFIEYQDKLEAAVKDYEASGKQEDKKPNPDYFIEKARYADYLGQRDWAIETLNKTFKYYENSSVAWNNLAKIYEEKKDYSKANEYYFKIMDTFGEKQMWGEYYYIIRNYMALGDKAKVREYYDKYLKMGGTKDGETEEYLR